METASETRDAVMSYIAEALLYLLSQQTTRDVTIENNLRTALSKLDQSIDWDEDEYE